MKGEFKFKCGQLKQDISQQTSVKSDLGLAHTTSKKFGKHFYFFG